MYVFMEKHNIVDEVRKAVVRTILSNRDSNFRGSAAL